MNEFVVTINNKKVTVNLPNENKALVNGKDYNYHIEKLNNYTYKLLIENKPIIITVVQKNNSELIITLNGKVIETKVLSSLQEKAARLIETAAPKHSTTIIKSPMPGMILKIKKTIGDDVTQGDSLLILEAMKMENDIRSPVSGKIKEIVIKEGHAVEKGATLLIIE